MSEIDLKTLDSAIGESIDAAVPPEDAKSHVLEVVRRLSTLDGLRPVPHCTGVLASVVSRNAKRHTVMVLLRFAAGGVLPGHGHEGNEDAYVVSGTCRIDGRSYAQGDFHRVEAGASHGDVVSDNGCVLLVTMDERDYRAA